MKGRCTSNKVSTWLSKKEVNIVRRIQPPFLMYVFFMKLRTHDNNNTIIIIIDNDINPSLTEYCNI